MRGVFVTGTGTEVGKTVVAACIAHSAAERGERVAVFKPAVSGLDQEGDPDHEVLRSAAGSEQSDDEIAPYRFDPPVSPHLAADLAGEPIDPERVLAAARAAAEGAELLVCEGVGGFLVPLTDDWLVRDFARELSHPVVVASSPGLGTINHTLLTIEAVRAAGLEVRAVALTPWPPEPNAMERSNRETIQRLGDVEIELIPQIDPERTKTWPRIDLKL